MGRGQKPFPSSFLFPIFYFSIKENWQRRRKTVGAKRRVGGHRESYAAGGMWLGGPIIAVFSRLAYHMGRKAFYGSMYENTFFGFLK